MEISYTSLIALAQIIPILLLASYFDKEALDRIRLYSKTTRISWFAIIVIIVVGELIAINGIVYSQAVGGVSAILVHLAAGFALLNLLNIAGWRILGLDLVSMMPAKKRKNDKK